MPAGHVDLSFRVKGSNSRGTVYFTSVRKDKGLPFTICAYICPLMVRKPINTSTVRFKVITDNGEVIHLVDEKKRPTW